MANKNTCNIVEGLIPVVDTAKTIYNTEPLTYLSVELIEDTVRVFSLGVDSEHYDEWFPDCSCDNQEEKEIALKLIRRINFPKENVKYNDKGIELNVNNSKIRRCSEAVHDLRNSDFYKELHQEEFSFYSVIVTNLDKFKKYCREYSDVVEAHYDDGIWQVSIN